MEFKDDEAVKLWVQFVEVNSKDDYSNCVVTYARRWAKYMQHLMQMHNKRIIEIADKASHVRDIERIIGFITDVRLTPWHSAGNTAKNSANGITKIMAMKKMALSILLY